MNVIGDILPLDHIVLDLPVSSKKRLFEQIGLLIENRADIARGNVFECLFAREKLGSTALGHGVAIPHGRYAGLSQPIGAFIRTQEPIGFDAPDTKPVNLIFALLVPEGANSIHLEVLSHLATRFSSKTVREQLLQANDAQTIQAILMAE
ncbi:PTS IIA-like nitrogen regulatory protein PtsN [Vitreoscilla stercoraria]|uniref:PTS IIA-like nitrogen regulatory protein PtsN n=1 Tax=Vitreoscilla stercoraria TaxID=61 RepID=A0ABY4EE47_VITST|nr:PTS IIA-like nitrogen regulatory protein PtsN [Vitreoscilla stercoraria]UOO93707.1 PTS IIA-like nitrogen regulatory protein PtsN [Vitreoscilla stercoraria]